LLSPAENTPRGAEEKGKGEEGVKSEIEVSLLSIAPLRAGGY